MSLKGLAIFLKQMSSVGWIGLDWIVFISPTFMTFESKGTSHISETKCLVLDGLDWIGLDIFISPSFMTYESKWTNYISETKCLVLDGLDWSCRTNNPCSSHASVYVCHTDGVIDV